mmetsp:Transcript_11596/g.45062  ORF Transcript_11596/g.45062 Transcript_11596/m.45062 type:complete len:227 (-) Transcript_11596:3752-4432(-)
MAGEGRRWLPRRVNADAGCEPHRSSREGNEQERQHHGETCHRGRGARRLGLRARRPPGQLSRGGSQRVAPGRRHCRPGSSRCLSKERVLLAASSLNGATACRRAREAGARSRKPDGLGSRSGAGAQRLPSGESRRPRQRLQLGRRRRRRRLRHRPVRVAARARLVRQYGHRRLAGPHPLLHAQAESGLPRSGPTLPHSSLSHSIAAARARRAVHAVALATKRCHGV